MNESLIFLSISYVALCVLFVWVWYKSDLGAKGKILLGILLPLVYYFHWLGLQESKGWPSNQVVPTQFELISADVVEPNQLKKISGNIHLWIRPEEDGTPRAFILPYTRALHNSLHKAKQGMTHGRAQLGFLFDEESKQRGVKIGGGMKLSFRDAPKKRLPPKRSR